ncbi:MAG: hypothetical protein MI924_23510 [Chloroflexales bacterium]|nr:hypothetical protein [Chloroflexales bacterium]
MTSLRRPKVGPWALIGLAVLTLSILPFFNIGSGNDPLGGSGLNPTLTVPVSTVNPVLPGTLNGSPTPSTTLVAGGPTQSIPAAQTGTPFVNATQGVAGGQPPPSPVPGFATATPTSVFGAPGATATPTSVFGVPGATATPTSVFGAPGITATPTSMFGGAQPPAPTSVLGSPTPTSVFGQPTPIIPTRPTLPNTGIVQVTAATSVVVIGVLLVWLGLTVRGVQRVNFANAELSEQIEATRQLVPLVETITELQQTTASGIKNVQGQSQHMASLLDDLKEKMETERQPRTNDEPSVKDRIENKMASILDFLK